MARAIGRARPDDRPRLRVEASEAEARLYVYDAIGWSGITASDFVAEVAALPAGVRTVHLHINSPGGDVFDARAMCAAVEAHPARWIAHVDGVAASAASYLAIAADEVEIARGAFFMVHRAWAATIGNAADHTATASFLEKIDETIAADFARRTGKDAAEVRAWLDAETWFGSEEAVAAGIADRVAEAPAEPAAASWDREILAAFDHVPEALRPAAAAAPPPAPEPPPAPPPETDDEEEERRRRLRAILLG